jgi:molecular chaperone DnaK
MRKALVVGCCKYDDPQIGNLKYAARDAVRFAETLTTYCGFRKDDVALLSDTSNLKPTRDSITTALASLVNADDIELLIIFFSGHGFHYSADGEDYLAMPSTHYVVPHLTSLRYSELLQVVKAVGAVATVMFIDACRNEITSGKALGSSALAPIDVADRGDRGVITVASCSESQYSFEDERIQAGVFTELLCRALSPNGKVTTVRELDEYLRRNAPRLGTELGRPRQRPQTAIDDLTLQDLELVDPSVRDLWRSLAPLGKELEAPSVMPIPINSSERLIACIDFGTTFSMVAIAHDSDDIAFVRSTDRTALVPSVAAFFPDGDYVLGRAAERAEPTRSQTIRGVKRLLGTGHALAINGRTVPPENVASLIIRGLREMAERSIQRPITRCLVAYPADFGFRRANALLKSFSDAGMDVIRMVGEPNIASVLIVSERPNWEGFYVVVDLGGGTFDVSVVEYGDGLCEIISVGGNNELGGIDYDRVLAQAMKRELAGQHAEFSELPPSFDDQFDAEARRVKHILSRSERATAVVELESGGNSLEFTMDFTRASVRPMTAALDAEIKRVFENTVADARLSRHGSIDLIFLTGQATRIFTVVETLAALMPGIEIVSKYQDNAVATGLARYSQVLLGRNRDVLLLDLSHRGIGIRGTEARTSPASAEGVRSAEATLLPRTNPGPDATLLMRPNPGPTTVIPILKRLWKIPIYNSTIVRFVADGSDIPETIQFDVIEASRVSESNELVGTLSFPSHGRAMVELEIVIDIDTNSAILLSAYNHATREVLFRQLNQRFRRARTISSRRELELVLDGWSVFTLQPIDDSPALNAPETRELLEIDRWIDTIQAEARQFVSDRRDQSFVPIDIANEDRRLATLLLAHGFVEHALPLLSATLQSLLDNDAWYYVALVMDMYLQIWPPIGPTSSAVRRSLDPRLSEIALLASLPCRLPQRSWAEFKSHIDSGIYPNMQKDIEAAAPLAAAEILRSYELITAPTT